MVDENRELIKFCYIKNGYEKHDNEIKSCPDIYIRGHYHEQYQFRQILKHLNIDYMISILDKTQIQSYLQELHTDSQNRTKFRNKYQVKILELLIELEQSKLAYDNLMKENLKTKNWGEKLQKELEVLNVKVEEAEQNANQFDLQIIDQVDSQVKGLNVEIIKLNDEIESLKENQQGKEKQFLECEQKFEQKIKQVENNKNKEIIELKNKNMSLQETYAASLAEKKAMEQYKVQSEKSFKEQLENSEKQYNNQLESKRNQWSALEKNICTKYNEKIYQMQVELEHIKQNQLQEKNNYSKTIDRLQSKIKAQEQHLSEALSEKNNYEVLHEKLEKEMKQKDKQVKQLKKINMEVNDKIKQIIQENQQIKLQLESIQIKRKQLAKRQGELKKQLEHKKEEYSSQNQLVNRQKQNIRELKDENRKLNQTIESHQLKIKELESNLYKANVGTTEEKKKVQELMVKIEYLQGSNIKLNERLALGENQRQTIVKSIVSQKQMVEKQNIKLLQMLQIKQIVLRSILQSSFELDSPKLLGLGSEIKTRETWANFGKENFKDSAVRRNAIDKWICN